MLRRLLMVLVIVTVAVGASSLPAFAQEKAGPEDTRDAAWQCITKTDYRFCVTNAGRLYDLQSPVGNDILWDGEYQLCTEGGYYIASPGYFNYYSHYQPNGVGTTPLSITVRTYNNTWEIKWSYTTDSAEDELLVTAVTKRVLSPHLWAYLEFAMDLDVNGADNIDVYDRSNHAIWQRGSSTGYANVLWAYSTAYTHYAMVVPQGNYYTPGNCFPGEIGRPGANDVASVITYWLGDVSAGSTRTRKFQFRRN
jgi:hypothetical protein